MSGSEPLEISKMDGREGMTGAIEPNRSEQAPVVRFGNTLHEVIARLAQVPEMWCEPRSTERRSAMGDDIHFVGVAVDFPPMG